MMSNAQKSVLNEMINTPIELFSFYTYLLEVLSKSKNKIKWNMRMSWKKYKHSCPQINIYLDFKVMRIQKSI